MKITALESMAYKPGGYRISVDGKPLGYVSAEDIFTLGLVLGRDLSPAAYSKLVQKVKFTAYYSQALKFADRRLRSRAEAATYLRLRGCEPEIIEEIVARLEKIGIIDEVKLARAYIHDAQVIKPQSKRAVRLRLKQKKIDPAVIDGALSGGSLSDEAALDALIAQKAHLSAYAGNQARFFRYLLNKGFAYEDIAKRIGRPQIKLRLRER